MSELIYKKEIYEIIGTWFNPFVFFRVFGGLNYYRITNNYSIELYKCCFDISF